MHCNLIRRQSVCRVKRMLSLYLHSACYSCSIFKKAYFPLIIMRGCALSAPYFTACLIKAASQFLDHIFAVLVILMLGCNPSIHNAISCAIPSAHDAFFILWFPTRQVQTWGTTFSRARLVAALCYDVGKCSECLISNSEIILLSGNFHVVTLLSYVTGT